MKLKIVREADWQIWNLIYRDCSNESELEKDESKI